ncbi:flagellar basal body-associated protein FliL [Acidimicrobiaceae bacterium USS-CC1]|uniref:Flagellar protein FliL n=1 Tax=Acidiferrimicrobium australe TaxID=2664430 RepID=A0ABW9QWE4_9ACTN|nr:flagellar basal body-associated protein FliL [Acidiferrimicrobium australe]
MATTTAAPPSAAAPAEAPKKKGRTKLLIIGVVVLLVVAGGAYKFVLKKKPAANAKPVPGVIITEGQQTINLAGGHYLQVRVALQLIKGASPKLIDADNAELADTVLQVFAGQPMSRLSGAAGLAWSKAHLLAALDPQFPHTIYTVYFTQFVTQ